MSKNLHRVIGINLSELRALCLGTVVADHKGGDANKGGDAIFPKTARIF